MTASKLSAAPVYPATGMGGAGIITNRQARAVAQGEVRKCDRCGAALGGHRGHGFPSPNGRLIECGHCFTLPWSPARIHVPTR